MTAKKLLRILLPLLLLPLAAGADLLLLWLGAIADGALSAGSSALGHPMPAVTLLAMLLCAALSLAAVIVTLVLVITGIRAAVRGSGDRHEKGSVTR